MNSRSNKLKFFSGLSFQFGMLMTVILVISMIIATLINYYENSKTTKETINTRLESIGRLLVEISVEPLLVYDFVSLTDYMQIAIKEKDIVFIQLSGKHNEAISRHISDSSQLAQQVIKQAATSDMELIFKQLATHPDVVSKELTIQLSGNKLGSVSLGLDRHSYDAAARKRLRKDVELTLLIALFAGLSIYLIFNRRILNPINRLKRAASNIAQFKLDEKIKPGSNDELGELASTFNDMTTHLSDAIEARNLSMEELKVLNESLEERIHERTLELQHLNNKVTHQAMHDPLTGLPNRTLIMARLKQSIHYAHRHKKTLAVFMMDLNRFKEVNDTLGHPVGDQVLISVSERLPKVLRETDTIGRLGGDEFVVILSETSPEQAIFVANKIQEEFVPDFEINGHQLSVGTSIGIALYPEHTEDPDSLIQKADIALYVAKKKHNYHIAVYDEAQDHHTLSRLLLVSDLKEAIDKEQLSLSYQPIVNLHSGKVCGVEALTRWHHPQHGFIPPDTFIPMAEDSGLIKSLTDAVLKFTIIQVAEWISKGIYLKVAVNLSIGNLLDPHLPERFAMMLKTYEVPANLIKLEITESMIMTDPERVIETLSAPIFKDVYIAIDDFGTGYSSLNHLKRLPVNEIKVDKSFVMDMTENPDDASIVQSIIHLADNLGLHVVAEGVENRETADQLIDLDCNYAQGYFYSKPVAAEGILQEIKEIENRLAEMPVN